MTPTKKTKTLYRVFTLLFILPLAASGTGFAIAFPSVKQGMEQLGYPLYIIQFLGVAKLLGAVAILSGRSPRIKEWAYAGFVFNLIGALYSHLCSGDGAKAIVPLVVLCLGVLSYVYWKKLTAITDDGVHRSLSSNEVSAGRLGSMGAV